MEIILRNIKSHKIIIILLFLFGTSSCYMLKNRTNSDIIYIDQIYDSINNKNITYNNLEYRALMKFSTSTEVYSFYSSVIIYKDSTLFLSAILPFGINLAKILLTQDSVKFYSPIQNKYLKGDSSFFLNNYNLALNYFSLQSILTATFFPYPYFYSKEKYESSSDSLFHIKNVVFNKRNTNIIDAQSIFSYDKKYLLRKVFIVDNILKRKLFITYSDYKKYDMNYFPSFIEISVVTITDTLKLTLKNKNFKINSNPVIKFNIPSNAKVFN